MSLIATEKTAIENVGYLFDGYDILFGSPMNAGTESGTAGPDPGFRQTIWEADYSDCLRSADDMKAVPRGLNVRVCEQSCKISFTSTIINGTKQYKDIMDNKVCVAATLGSETTCREKDSSNEDSANDERSNEDGERKKRSVGKYRPRRKRFVPALFGNIFGKIFGGRGGRSRSRESNSRSRGSRSRRSRESGSRSRGSKSKEKKKGASRSASDIFRDSSGGSSEDGRWKEGLGWGAGFGIGGGDFGDGDESGSNAPRFQVKLSFVACKLVMGRVYPNLKTRPEPEVFFQIRKT